MRKKVDDPRLMIKVCDLYYNQNASRQEIGQELGLSRPTIARLLDSAREQGLVRIEIPDLDTIAYWELEKKLEEKYGLRQVLVVDGSDDKDALESALGSSAARYLQYCRCIDGIYPSPHGIGITEGSGRAGNLRAISRWHGKTSDGTSCQQSGGEDVKVGRWNIYPIARTGESIQYTGAG